MVGSGAAHIRTVCSIAQAAVEDARARNQACPDSILAFASLGNFGRCPANEERDMHNWLKNLYGIDLELYYVQMHLEVPLLSGRARLGLSFFLNLFEIFSEVHF